VADKYRANVLTPEGWVSVHEGSHEEVRSVLLNAVQNGIVEVSVDGNVQMFKVIRGSIAKV